MTNRVSIKCISTDAYLRFFWSVPPINSALKAFSSTLLYPTR